MKPHIKREYSITCKRNMWFCRGMGVLAMGDTWREALRFWSFNFVWIQGAKKWVRL